MNYNTSQKFYIPPSIENRKILFGLEKEEMMIIMSSLGSLMFIGGIMGIIFAIIGISLAKKLKDKKSEEQSYMARICYKYPKLVNN